MASQNTKVVSSLILTLNRLAINNERDDDLLHGAAIDAFANELDDYF